MAGVAVSAVSDLLAVEMASLDRLHGGAGVANRAVAPVLGMRAKQGSPTRSRKIRRLRLAPRTGRRLRCRQTDQRRVASGDAGSKSSLPPVLPGPQPRARFASAMRFRLVRSSLPVGVRGILSRTIISSGAL